MYDLSRDTTGQDANRMPRRRQRKQGGEEEDSDTAEGEDFKEQAVKATYKSRGNYGQGTLQEGGHRDNAQQRPNAIGRQRPNCCAFTSPNASPCCYFRSPNKPKPHHTQNKNGSEVIDILDTTDDSIGPQDNDRKK